MIRFEEIVRALPIPNANSFALPYWDWTANPRLPRAFYSAPLTTGEISRTQDMSPAIARQTNMNVLSRLMATNDFEAFMGSAGSAGQIEVGPHNAVHATLSGTMGTFSSPLDPIFWLHHCNVDRLWAEWQAANSQYTLNVIRANYRDWLSESLNGFYDHNGDRVETPRTAQAMLVTGTTGRMYAYGRPPGASNAIVVPAVGAAPAPSPPGGRASDKALEKKFSTSDQINVVIEKKDPQAGTYIIEFPEFREGTEAAKYLNAYIVEHQPGHSGPVPSHNYVYLLKVHNFPQLHSGVSMNVSLLVNAEPFDVFSHNFFVRTRADKKFGDRMKAALRENSKPQAQAQAHKHVESNSFNIDYKMVLSAMVNGAKLKTYPEKTRYVVRFVDNLTGKPYALDVDASKLVFQLFIRG